MSENETATEVAEVKVTEKQEAQVEKIITSSSPITLVDDRFIIVHNANLVNPQIIDFITTFMRQDQAIMDGCYSITFRNDGPPYEYDADENSHISALGAYNHETLSMVINLAGIFENAGEAIASGDAPEALPALMYHLLRRTAIHELLHGEDYVSAKNKLAWIENPEDEEVQKMAMLHLIEMAKLHPSLTELPGYTTGDNWFDKAIVESIETMREGKVVQWEKDQLFLIDNHKICVTEDGDYITSMREYYRGLADDGTDASWDTVIEETPILVPEVTETSEVAKAEDVTPPAPQTVEQQIAGALSTGDTTAIAQLLSQLSANPPAQTITQEDVNTGAAVPIEEAPFDGGVPDTIQSVTSGPAAELLAKMNANVATLGANRPLTNDEVTIRNIFEALFTEMFNKCGFEQGHWTTPVGILDPVTINIPGAAAVIHSFDYTNGAGQYVKGELFGGQIKGQIDNRADKLHRPAYVLHLKVAGIVLTRRLQPVYVLNPNGTMREIPADKQATSLTYMAQQGTQVAVLRDPVEQKTKFNLIRQPDGSIKWEQWK